MERNRRRVDDEGAERIDMELYAITVNLESAAPIPRADLDQLVVALQARLALPIVVERDGRTTTLVVKDVVLG